MDRGLYMYLIRKGYTKEEAEQATRQVNTAQGIPEHMKLDCKRYWIDKAAQSIDRGKA